MATAVASGQLHAHSAKVSTRFNLEMMKKKVKKPNHVICVYTSKERMDEVGFKLITLVKYKQIGYKLDEATCQELYA